MRTRIKFCGMRRSTDIALSCALGIDAIGFIFAQRSQRSLTLDQAVALRDAIPSLVHLVALFSDNPAAEVHRVIDAIHPSVLQFHGHETDAFCQQFGRPYWKAIAMADSHAVSAQCLHRDYPHAAAYLFDSHADGQAGGTGRSFDWQQIPPMLRRPTILAGGLTTTTVAQAIRIAHPWGVDVCSGIEVAPGIKDANAMRRFVAQVHAADQQLCAADGTPRP